jgi:hypothetical protein
MHVKRLVLCLAVSGALLLAASMVGAQLQEPYLLGEITLEAKQVAAGVGYTWGDGKLRFKNKEYPFSIQGLNVAAVGLSRISAKGDVYNLKDAADFPGNYVAAEAGAAVIKGKAGLVMRNAKGVVINLVSTTEGVQLSLGGQGLTIKMK